jgi:hypothetical protein
MRTSKRQISSITGVLSHFGLRKANGDIGVVAGVRDLPGIADFVSLMICPLMNPAPMCESISSSIGK